MKKRILLVDDDKNLREILARYLNFPGCGLDTAVDGLEAVCMLGRKRYDLIITDFEMPNMNGAELARLVKKDYPFPSIIAITGNDNPHDLYKAGIEICFKKPFDYSGLKKTVHKLLFDKASEPQF